MVSADQFWIDISETSFASPLVGVSYIPLSHSSDRLRVWEFLGNGGRVGFAFYDASNWAAHEHGKKEVAPESFGLDNNVAGLMRQIKPLSPLGGSTWLVTSHACRLTPLCRVSQHLRSHLVFGTGFTTSSSNALLPPSTSRLLRVRVCDHAWCCTVADSLTPHARRGATRDLGARPRGLCRYFRLSC